MATLTVTNLTTSDVYLSDLYTSVPASGSVATTRSVPDLQRMAGLQAAVAAGTVSIAVAFSAAEKASGLVDQGDIAATLTAGGSADTLAVRVVLTDGGQAAADDVPVYALGALPFAKMRVLDVIAYVTGGQGVAETLQVRTAAAGAGTLLAELDASATGRLAHTATVTSTAVLTNGASVGLFIRRSSDAIEGEVVILLRPES